MKTSKSNLIRTLTLVLSLGAAPTLGALEVSLAPTGFLGLTYAGQWSPAYSATGLALQVQDTWVENYRWTAGLELTAAGLGAQILVPLGLDLRLPLTGFPGALDLSLTALPGFTLTRPRPLLLIGGEFRVQGSWQWADNWSLGLFTGLRYTTCPEYSQKVLDYSLWDLPFGLSVTWRS